MLQSMLGLGLIAATVVAPTAMEADALATALLVLGPERGLELVERCGLTAHLVVRTEGGPVALSSAGFDAEALP